MLKKIRFTAILRKCLLTRDFTMDRTEKNHFEKLVSRIPELDFLLPKLNQLAADMIGLYRNGGTLFLAGNGGSCCDCEHIAGELLKGFKRMRPLPDDLKQKYQENFGGRGAYIASKLQQGLRAVTLNSHPGLVSAFSNDVDGDLTYAQQLNALAKAGDILIGISTGGNASNIEAAFMTARMNNVKTVLFTGNRHGKCEQYADLVIDAPHAETYVIQEYHIAIYHALCLEVEAAFFDV